MTSNINILTTVLIIALSIFFILLVVLAFVYFNMKLKEKQAGKPAKTIQDNSNNTEQHKTKKVKQYTTDSIFNFMEFDKIEDNMIVQKDGSKYVMVIECQGVNYDLMSSEEKNSVEAGFAQFLNTLTGPIQIYTQTRTINLENSIQNYKDRVNQIEIEYNKQKERYERLQRRDDVTEEQLKRERYEYIKQKNLYEYGKDIIYNTEKMSLNRSILSKKYYVAIAYYTAELGQNNYDKEEIRELAFSDLYTKAQALIRALSVSGVNGKIMSSTELLDLLYVAYNRDESETYGVDKAIRARYDELYSTATDYMEEKMRMLDQEIERQAYNKANQKVIEAQNERERRYKEKEDNISDLIADLATRIIEESTESIGEDIAEEAKKKIQEEKKVRGRRKNVKAKAE